MTAAHPLAATVPAAATHVGGLRRTLRRWLSDALDDPDAVDDLVLAASEALENVVDHAFVGAAEVGTMTLSAADDGDHVTIIVSDNGQWQPPDAGAGYRGRGIDLIHRLVEVSRVIVGAGGTTVTLTYPHAPSTAPLAG